MGLYCLSGYHAGGSGSCPTIDVSSCKLQALLFLRLGCKSLVGFESSVDCERPCRSIPEERKLLSRLYDVKKEEMGCVWRRRCCGLRFVR